MSRQIKSFKKPIDEQLKTQTDWLRAKLEHAENSGFTTDSKKQILMHSKAMLH